MPPLRFVFGVHFHQPVGNFDYVLEQHVRDVYLPLLEHIAEREFFPIVLHLSGPLLEWLETHNRNYLDLLGRLAGDGRIELLLAGYYEPVLASLPREDRLEQIAWMREALANRFGVDARGLWLTERVWEPDLAADLADAGVHYALVDDRHFLVSGFQREQLHAPFWTESGGKRVALFPIDEKLRYLVPFLPPADTATYLRSLSGEGHRLAVLADDGEKFGGWPGTKDWVYDRGWLLDFLSTMGRLIANGEVKLSTLAEAFEHVPSGGLAYLSTASYREMEGWALPRDAALRLTRLEHDMGEQRVAGPDGALVRGSHWRNFLVKYPESNRMHKKMQALSALSRQRGDPPSARRAIGRGQCNDAYWHGVFGGLYLPHLREAIWKQLAIAESTLRRGEELQAEVLDLDADGHAEIWVHSSRFSGVVAPRRGGAVEELTLFESGRNFANTLTRRREAYHQIGEPTSVEAEPRHSTDGTPSIHEIEQGIRLQELPPSDLEDRAILVDRVLAQHQSFDGYSRGDYQPVKSWARVPFEFRIESSSERVEVVLLAPDRSSEKRLVFTADGVLRASYRWDPAAFPVEGYFAPELSLAGPINMTFTPTTEVWSFPIETVAKSERGLDRTVQGESYTPRWPVSAGAAEIELRPRSGE